jgi:hypothetical protein
MAATHAEATGDSRSIIAKPRRERNAALADKAALVEAMEVIDRSRGDPGPAFETILETAHDLCGAAIGSPMTYEGAFFRAVRHVYPDEPSAFRGQLHDIFAEKRRLSSERQLWALPARW